MKLSFLSIQRGTLLVALSFLLVCAATVRSLASPQATDAQAAFNQALGLLQAGKTADALTTIDIAIAAGARDPSLYNLKGLAAGELGHAQEASLARRRTLFERESE